MSSADTGDQFSARACGLMSGVMVAWNDHKDLLAQYEADPTPARMREARFSIFWKLAFVVSLPAETAADRKVQMRCHELLEELAATGPDVPWPSNMARLLEKYRAWGRAGGRSFEDASRV